MINNNLRNINLCWYVGYGCRAQYVSVGFGYYGNQCCYYRSIGYVFPDDEYNDSCFFPSYGYCFTNGEGWCFFVLEESYYIDSGGLEIYD